VTLAAHDPPLRIGADPEDAARLATELGPAARALREVPPERVPEVRAAAEAAIAKALRPLAGADGVVLRGAVWVVSARA
jgi:hypothetical protein